jgi:hypothetical protein
MTISVLFMGTLWYLFVTFAAYGPVMKMGAEALQQLGCRSNVDFLLVLCLIKNIESS